MFSRVNVVGLVTLALASCQFAVAQTATDRLTVLTQNQSFEQNKAGWNGNNTVVSLLRRDWETDPNVAREAELGSRLCRLSRVGAYSQWVDIDPSSPYQIVAIQASRNAIRKGGWAGFGVTYLDANGDVVAAYEKEIEGNSGSRRGVGDGLIPLSIGAFVPESAFTAVIWVYNGINRGSVFFDEFALFDVQTSNTANKMASEYDLQDVIGTPTTLTGTEFLLPGDESSDSGINPTFAFTGGFKGFPLTRVAAVAIGQAGRATVAYQPLRLAPGTRYELFYPYQEADAANVAVGVDYFDANGNEVGEVMTVLQHSTPNPFVAASRLNVTLPAKAVSATFWVYAGPTDRPAKFIGFRLIQR